MTDTLHLALPMIAAAQAQKHVTYNEALRSLDALVMLSVLDRDLTAPPGSPAEGARYLVQATGTGAFAGRDGQIAHFRDGAWAFHSPRAGWIAHVADEDTLLVHDGSAWRSLIDPMRERLTAARIYYVRTDGNDSNNGLSDTAGDAFLTIQKAVDVVFGTLDLSTFDVTIQLGDGTYAGGGIMTGLRLGSGSITIQGNAAHPENVIVDVSGSSPSTQACFLAAHGARLIVKDMELRTNGSIHCLNARAGGLIEFSNLRFGACASSHARSDSNGVIEGIGNYQISGGAVAHWSAAIGGVIRVQSRTITLIGTPAFSTAFAVGLLGGIIAANSNTFSGGANGQRYNLATNAALNTGGAGASYLPGDMAGATATGGEYA